MRDLEKELLEVNPRETTQYICYCLMANLVPFLVSSPGCGKSSLVKDIAKKYNLALIDHRLSTSDVTDLNGLPQFKDGKAVFTPFNIFPTKDTQIPDGKNGWLLFLDEFNSAPRAIQAAAYKIILDKTIGQYELHPNCFIICAGNNMNDRAITQELSTAMVSRLVHIHMSCDFDTWMEDVAYRNNYNPTLIAYLQCNREELNTFDPEEDSGLPYNCPRTWSMVNSILQLPEFKLTEETTPLLAGIISKGTAYKFLAFSKLADDIVTPQEIIKSPSNAKIPSALETQWATISNLIGYTTPDNLKEIDTYIDRYNDISLQIMYYKAIKSKDPVIIQHPVFKARLPKIAAYMR